MPRPWTTLATAVVVWIHGGAVLAADRPAPRSTKAEAKAKERQRIREELGRGGWVDLGSRWLPAKGPPKSWLDLVPRGGWAWKEAKVRSQVGTLRIRAQGKALVVEDQVPERRGHRKGFLATRIARSVEVPATPSDEPLNVHQRSFETLLDQIRRDFIREIPVTELHEGAMGALREHAGKTTNETHAYETAMWGAAARLQDPHSGHAGKGAWQAMWEMSQGHAAGFGILFEHDGSLATVSPRSPASRAGLRPGDRIVGVDGVAVANGEELDRQLVEALRRPGRARLEVERNGIRRTVVVRPGPYRTASLHADLTRDGVAVLRFDEFYPTVAEEAWHALIQLAAAHGGMLRGIVVDLRNNPGGFKDALLDFVSQHVDRGPLGEYRGRHGKDLEVLRPRGPGEFRDVPIALLINRRSASASEVATAILRAKRGALVIGERSHGKLSRQLHRTLPDGSGAAITDAHYRDPNGNELHGKGIDPDLSGKEARRQARVLFSGQKLEDPVMRRADDVLRYAIWRMGRGRAVVVPGLSRVRLRVRGGPYVVFQHGPHLRQVIEEGRD